MSTEEKKQNGRPCKIEKWTKVCEQVLNDDINAIIYTDEELLYLVNSKMDNKEDTVSIARFNAWKAGTLKNKDELLEKFREVIKKALLIQKDSLFKSLRDKDDIWTKYAWIIERKFSAWNLKKISETDLTSKGEKLTIDWEKGK